MWDQSEPSERLFGEAQLSIEQVLYEYDGPQIFTARLGFISFLFVKFEEGEKFDLFLAAPMDEGLLGQITSGFLSLRAAFERGQLYIVRVAAKYKVDAFWVCRSEDVPEDFFPRPNTGLLISSKKLPNSVLQLESFFAMSFRGMAMKRGGMPFSLFKNLVDNSHDAAKRILSPASVARLRSSTFDFQVAPPRFGSLTIAVNKPLIDETKLRRATKNPDLSGVGVADELSAKREIFFEEMAELIDQAGKGNISDSFASDNYSLLDNVSGIIPSEDNRIDNLELSAQIDDSPANVFVDRGTGDRINAAHKRASVSTITEKGKIFIINGKSNSFVMTSDRGREVSCYLPSEIFETLRRNELFRDGARIAVKGELTRRPVRDYLRVDAAPKIADADVGGFGNKPA